MQPVQDDYMTIQDAWMILLSIRRFRKSSLSILAISSFSSVKRSSHFVMFSLSYIGRSSGADNSQRANYIRTDY